MTDILEEICAHKRMELESTKERTPARELYRKVERLMDEDAPARSLSKSLTESPTGIIAEFKRKSPSKGWINSDADPTVVTPGYQKAGAAALSILTNTQYFGGSLDDVRAARPLVSIPILRKEFVVDEYQLFEAKEAGADAVLLIAACLSREECRSFARTARELGLETLLEVHSEAELDYLDADICVVGVNNRNLHVFKTDIQTSVDLAAKIPGEFTKISESGLSDPADIRSLRLYGYRGFLMGERFMKAADPAGELQAFTEALR
jgi:indole-3-glycerol phosphate synthase